ncbi:hypothetical protein X735_12540 [Mesorhizobium sp. L2C085B000]|uniref:hypothetical protein n=1 Tax=Mesorhizobium sp. L2C085B000 TaxID=1287117 RepID=UPI0003CFADF0|nr:hypothetical protein [Mesorhizobium sp. L2C085B000]ESZ17791.1 hypothetical protein X735_12540 [Mesorhizobium sp. L2C085B000]
MTVILENLPFLSGKESVVRSVARWHEWATHNEPNNWQDLLDKSDRALEIVGREIAAAKSSAEAAAASLRWQTYDTGRAQMIATLLGIAKRRMQAQPIFAADQGRAIGFIAFGKDAIGGTLKAIPLSHWEAGSMDWDRSILSVADGVQWYGVKILDLFDLESGLGAQLVEEINEPALDENEGTGGPGRPTSLHLVEIEFRRRRDAGQLKASLAGECDHLAAWLKSTHPSRPQMTSKTIQNRIRAEFKSARK